METNKVDNQQEIREGAKQCDCCDEADEHIFPEDRSTTRISRPCGGCGEHQTIAGALLKSKYWKDWYEHASRNMLYDVDETYTIDAMSDGHFEDFIKNVISQAIEQERERLMPYLEHSKSCILQDFERGEPTENGGYRVMYRRKWYEAKPKDKSPNCDCGLKELITNK